MSGALVLPLTECRFKLAQYDILCKVLRLLPAGIDEEPLHEAVGGSRSAEAEEIFNAAGRVWTRQLKTIDERLRWKLKSDSLDIHGVEYLEGLNQSVRLLSGYREAVRTNSENAWNTLRIVFDFYNAKLQLKRTHEDDEWGSDFKEKMDAFTQELRRYARNLHEDLRNFDPQDPQWMDRTPHGFSDAKALEEQFMRLLICVFDIGLSKTEKAWRRGPPMSDPSNWRTDVLNDASFISWLTVAAWKVLAIPDTFADPYDEYWGAWGTWISRDAKEFRKEVQNYDKESIDKMTELIVEMAKAKLGRTDTEVKVNFEYNRHYHNQLSQLLELLQPFSDASQRTTEELQALVMQHERAQNAEASVWKVLHTKFDEFGGAMGSEILPYCDTFYLQTLETMGPWVAHHVRDWFCEFRDLLIELCTTIMKFMATVDRSWGRELRLYRMVTLITKMMAHMYDVPTQHTGKMTYQAYKDPLNKRVKYLQDKEWMQLLQDTAWIVFCTDYRSAYAVNPRVLSMIDAYRGALDVIQHKEHEDVYVKFVETQRDGRDTSDTTRPATAPDHGTRLALLELQALYNNS
jgi:hypothetical protein